MAAIGNLSRVLLRSALAQSRRQFSANAATHAEHSGTYVVLICSLYLVWYIQSNELFGFFSDLAALSLAI